MKEQAALRRLSVTIVGGSVAGCAAGIELANAGHQVAIHERSTTGLSSQGVGIGIDQATRERLVEQRLMDASVPGVEAQVIRYVHRSRSETRWIGDVNAPAATYRWSDLFAGLRALVPDSSYHVGSHVTIDSDGLLGDTSGNSISTAASERDLVIFADGQASAGRSYVAAGALPVYQGLILWRGLLPEGEIDVSRFEGARTRVLYPGGHGVVYLVPGQEGSQPGCRYLLWAFYLPLADAELSTVLTDSSGRQHAGSVPLGHTDNSVTRSLRQRLAPLIPDLYTTFIDRSAVTTIQAITEVSSWSSHRGRHCLVGDAASVVPPYTGSGVLKAIDDAVSLRDNLEGGATLDAALHAWSVHQQTTAHHVRLLARRNRQALIDEVPDFDPMTPDERRDWLTRLHPNATLELPNHRSNR